MRRILSSNLLRQLTILEAIIDSDEQSPQQLNQTLKVAEKTIRKDIAAINHIIAPLNVHVAQTGKYQLVWLENYEVSYIYSRFLYASTEFNILEKILVDEELTYNELADAVFISVSTLRRAITRMNLILVEKGIEIVTNPVRVRGDETNVLNFYYNYLKEKYIVSNRLLSRFESNIIDDTLLDVLPHFTLRWSFTLSESVKWLVKINAIRMMNANHLPEKVSESDRTRADLARKVKPFDERLEKVFNVPIADRLVDIIIQEGYALSIEELAVLAKKDPVVSAKLKAIRTILTGIEKDMRLRCKAKERLVLTLYNKLIARESRSYLLNDSKDEFLAVLQQEKESFINILVVHYIKQVPILEKRLLPKFAFYITTEWDELHDMMNKVEDKMKIGLFFSTTNSHINFLQEELNRKLSPQILLINLNDQVIANLNEAEVDLIVTNISNLTTKKRSLCISEYPSEEDIIKISRVYENWLDAK